MSFLTRRNTLGLLATLPALGLTSPARAAEPPVFQTSGIAINGVDPVAYFTQDGPVQGDMTLSADHNGARFLFATVDNRDVFIGDPDRYAPVFGGYCAYAVSRAYIAPTRPDAWSIVDGRLYLNANLRIRRRWLRDVPGNIAKGQANWPSVLG